MCCASVPYKWTQSWKAALTFLPNKQSDISASQGLGPSHSSRSWVSSHSANHTHSHTVIQQCLQTQVQYLLYWGGFAPGVWHRNWLLSARQLAFILPCSFCPFCSTACGSGLQKCRSEAVVRYKENSLFHGAALRFVDQA